MGILHFANEQKPKWSAKIHDNTAGVSCVIETKDPRGCPLLLVVWEDDTVVINGNVCVDASELKMALNEARVAITHAVQSQCLNRK
jgi:hypothetical protein